MVIWVVGSAANRSEWQKTGSADGPADLPSLPRPELPRLQRAARAARVFSEISQIHIVHPLPRQLQMAKDDLMIAMEDLMGGEEFPLTGLPPKTNPSST